MTTANPLAQLSQAALESAVSLTRISFDSTERAIAVQLEYAKGYLAQASENVRAVSQVKVCWRGLRVPRSVPTLGASAQKCLNPRTGGEYGSPSRLHTTVCPATS